MVESAGTYALTGRPAEPEVVELMQARGLDVSAHRARQLTPAMARAFDLILVMDASHQRAVESLEPSVRGRVHRLGRVSGFDVPDPFRQDRAAFERSLAFIERGLADFENAFWSPRT